MECGQRDNLAQLRGWRSTKHENCYVADPEVSGESVVPICDRACDDEAYEVVGSAKKALLTDEVKTDEGSVGNKNIWRGRRLRGTSAIKVAMKHGRASSVLGPEDDGDPTKGVASGGLDAGASRGAIAPRLPWS